MAAPAQDQDNQRKASINLIMNDKDLDIQLKAARAKLHRGDQRVIADRLGVLPARVSDSFNGYVKSVHFLKRVLAECDRIESNRSAQT